jgi:hypothetical protein
VKPTASTSGKRPGPGTVTAPKRRRRASFTATRPAIVSSAGGQTSRFTYFAGPSFFAIRVTVSHSRSISFFVDSGS